MEEIVLFMFVLSVPSTGSSILHACWINGLINDPWSGWSLDLCSSLFCSNQCPCMYEGLCETPLSTPALQAVPRTLPDFCSLIRHRSLELIQLEGVEQKTGVSVQDLTNAVLRSELTPNSSDEYCCNLMQSLILFSEQGKTIW